VYRLEFNGGNIWLYWVSGGLGVGGGLCGYFGKLYSFIIGTSVYGSYVFVKSIGVMVGNWPEELTLANDIFGGKEDGVPGVYWVYLGLVVGLAGGSIGLQLF
jgi:hypothetical protein